VVEVAAEKNSTLVMPFPVELLRFFEAAAGAVSRPAATASEQNGRAPVDAATTVLPEGRG
jgi:hypothetical protein